MDWFNITHEDSGYELKLKAFGDTLTINIDNKSESPIMALTNDEVDELHTYLTHLILERSE